jgi:large subunit ribosomal protein L33
MAKKGSRVQVILECTEHKTSGQPGTSRYITNKNKKNTPERLELKKYNPILKKVTVHKEIKYPFTKKLNNYGKGRENRYQDQRLQGCRRSKELDEGHPGRT